MKYIPPLNAMPGEEENANRDHWNADPSSAILAAREGAYPSAVWMNAVQREIVNAIIAAGIVPDGNDYTQLTQAILALIEANIPTPESTEPATVAAATTEAQGIVELATDAEALSGALSNRALVPSNFAMRSHSANGYQKLPGGLMLQWGRLGTATLDQTTHTVTFPVSFSETAYSVTATIRLGSYVSGTVSPIILSVGSSNFTIEGDHDTDSSITGYIYWFAIGKA